MGEARVGGVGEGRGHGEVATCRGVWLVGFASHAILRVRMLLREREVKSLKGEMVSDMEVEGFGARC